MLSGTSAGNNLEEAKKRVSKALGDWDREDLVREESVDTAIETKHNSLSPLRCCVMATCFYGCSQILDNSSYRFDLTKQTALELGVGTGLAFFFGIVSGGSEPGGCH